MIFNLLIFTLSLGAMAQGKVVYKYKAYERFDLGDMEIKGELIAPGDLTVKERSTRFFSRELYNRTKYSKELIQASTAPRRPASRRSEVACMPPQRRGPGGIEAHAS